MEESAPGSPRIEEDILKTLTENPVFVAPSHSEMTNASTSVFIFVKHSGKFSRLAAYKPEQLLYEDNPPLTPVASAMKSLLQSAGVLSPDGQGEENEIQRNPGTPYQLLTK